MVVRDDTLIYPIVSDLAACLCAEYVGSDEHLCFCGIEPSTGVPINVGECDGGACGAATVRLVRLYPSTNFPNVDGTATCVTLLAAELVVTVLRCVPVGGDDGSNPTAAEYALWAQQQYADMIAMRRAIVCCFGDLHADTDYRLVDYTPVAPQGGVGGGQWRLFTRQEF